MIDYQLVKKYRNMYSILELVTVPLLHKEQENNTHPNSEEFYTASLSSGLKSKSSKRSA
jgi:hypothetical protein